MKTSLALAAAMGAVAVAGSACTVDTMNAIEKQILAFPTLKSCDQPTPGWSFYDFYTEDNAFPTSAQIATFESYPPCKTVYEAFQKVINETTACDYYPNEPIQKLGSFGTFSQLVDYVKSHEYKSISNAKETSTGNSTTGNSNIANNNGTSLAVTTAPLSHCTVADIGSITAQIKAIPQNAECANTTKFNFEDFFAQTNIFPSSAQMDLFSATRACEILLVDVQIILRQGPACLFYDNVSLQQMANFTSIQDIVQLEMMHEHPNGQSPTTAIPGSSSSTSTKASTENGAGASAVSVIGVIAIVAAAVLAVVGAIWYIRRKRQHHDKLDQQSIYVVNAHAAL